MRRGTAELLRLVACLLVLAPSVARPATYAYISNQDSNTISVIDTAINSVVATIPAGSKPYGIAIAASGTRLYVSNQGGSSVSVFDIPSNVLRATIPVGFSPYGIAVNSTGTRAYVSNASSDTVSVIDTSSNTVAATISTPNGPVGIAVNPSGTRAYVASNVGANVRVIDTSTNTVLTTVAIGNNPVGVAVKPDGTRVYVACQSGTVAVVDAATNSLLTSIAVGATPTAVALNPSGTRAYVTKINGAGIDVIDTATNTVIASPGTGLFPIGVAVNPSGTRAYVANANSATITVIDTATNTSIATVPVGTTPVALGAFVTDVSLVPGAPSIGGATAGNGEAIVTFSPPGATGATEITKYTVTASPGGMQASATSSPILVGQLTNGTTYTFTVAATNGNGTGPASSPSNAVTPTSTPAIAAGATHSLATRADGSVVAWGYDWMGQLGLGTQVTFPLPVVAFPNTPKIASMAMKENHALAVMEDATVWASGDNASGQLGDGTTITRSFPARVSGLTNVVAVAAGDLYSIALTQAGEVWMWGYGVLTPVRISQLTGIASISAGSNHSLAVDANGEVWTWSGYVAPVKVSGLPAIKGVSAGGSHSLALANNGTVWAWGLNTYGQLGDGTQVDRPTPIQVQNLLGVSAIVAGYWHSAAVMGDHTVRAWGASFQGEAGPIGVHPSPVTINGIDHVTALAAGWQYTTALRDDGHVWAWGWNIYGQLGDGSKISRPTPAPVLNVQNASSISGTLAVTTTGGAWGWGYGGTGEFGGSIATSRTAPVPVPGLTGIVDVSASWTTSFALKADGSLWAWGLNTWGMLGDGTAVLRSSPVQVSGISGVRAVAAGTYHTVALTNDGKVWSWGLGAELLGLGAGVGQTMTPQAVPGIAGATKISASGGHQFGGHTLVLKNDGTVWSWGSNTAGQVGNGTVVAQFSPVQVSGLGDVFAIATGAAFSLALKNDGTVWAWGDIIASSTPTLVPGLSNVVAIAGGDSYALAVKADGSVWAWGQNGVGQLGDGTTSFSASPVQVSNLDSVKRVVAGQPFGGAHTLALKSDTSVWSWGSNSYGQVGDGTYVSRSRPVVVVSPGGAGTLEGNDWFLHLDASKPATIPAAATPKMLVVAQRTGGDLAATLKYAQSDIGKEVDVYILGLVPPSFFDEVPLAPGFRSGERIQAKDATLVLAQLTPQGWTNVLGVLVAYSRAVANAVGSSQKILDSVKLPAGSRFCIGYGETADAMLKKETLREVLKLDGVSSTVYGVQCVLSGVYLAGPNPPSSPVGAPVTFTASVVGVSPTGKVQFNDRFNNLVQDLGGQLTLVPSNEAVATQQLTTSALAAGLHGIGAHYFGDNNNNAASDVTKRLDHMVNALQSTTSITGPMTSTWRDPVTFTASVTGNNPMGTVQFRDAGSDLGSAVPLAGVQASIDLQGLVAGTHSVTATYSGDANNAGSTSIVFQHVVAKATPSVALSSSLNPSLSNGQVTLTATVSGAVTGSVDFKDGNASLGAAPLANGSAKLVVTFTQGSHSLQAHYVGDGNNVAANSSVVTQTVNPTTLSPSITTLQSTPNPSSLANPVTLTASVTGSAGTATGTVAFADGNTTLAGCAAMPLAFGSASCTTNALAAGGHTLSATYSGSGTYLTSSGSAAHTVNAGTPLLSVSPSILDFGGQSMNTTSPALSANVTNSSSNDVTVTSITAPASFSVVAHNCGTLAPSASCTASFTFTPGVASDMAGFASIGYGGGGPTVLTLSGTGERSLVTHYYRSILRRDPDAGGKAFWEGEARRFQNIGANINETWFSMAQFFYFSAEYASLNRDNAGFVTDLYNTFFNRAPDAGGLNFWVGQINAGMPREVVLAFFMFSNEFVTFAQGIFGNTAARAEIDTVMDFYRGLLARTPDPGGFDFWVQRFRVAQCQGAGFVYGEVESISSQFANGGEYLGKNRTNNQYVGDLYNSFLRRGGDLVGVQFWINQLGSGALTRNQVRQNFVASGEFQGRVGAVVAQGCLP